VTDPLQALLDGWAAQDLSPTELLLLLGAALVAGFVDAIAGGGGLLTLPALLAVGLPPHLALGTNKGQSVWGSGAALSGFLRAGKVDRARAPAAFGLGFAGSLLGAALVMAVSPAVLKPVVMGLLAAVALIMVFRPPLVADPEKAKRPHAARLAHGLAFGVAVYDGFFGPGTGTFLIIGYALLLGLPLVAASADAKVVNFASNLAALLIFAARGSVLWSVALLMALGQLVGGLLGSRVALQGGDRLVRVVVLCVVVALITKLAVVG
jgi:uncharacterized membrane protein YfcA